MVDDDESITIDVTEHPVTDEQKAGWEMSYCDKHQVYWVLDEGSCPSCERGAKPISYGKDRNGGVRAIYIHGVEVVGAVLSSEAVDLVDRVNALLRVYDAEIQHALGSVRLLGDERDTLRAENERLREVRRTVVPLEFYDGRWSVGHSEREPDAVITYATEPCMETGHVGWCWWAKGRMGDATTLAEAMKRARAALGGGK